MRNASSSVDATLLVNISNLTAKIINFSIHRCCRIDLVSPQNITKNPLYTAGKAGSETTYRSTNAITGNIIQFKLRAVRHRVNHGIGNGFKAFKVIEIGIDDIYSRIFWWRKG